MRQTETVWLLAAIVCVLVAAVIFYSAKKSRTGVVNAGAIGGISFLLWLIFCLVVRVLPR